MLSVLLIGLLLAFLISCDSSGGSADSGSGKKQPASLYMLEYYCDENGTYVPELNEEPDYSGYPRTELERLYDDKDTYWCEIAEDGTGRYYTPFESSFEDTVELELDAAKGEFTYDEYYFNDYKYDAKTDTFWFGADNFWYRMRPCTQEDLDFVAAGKGGSVAIDKAEVGNLVCLGTYDTYPFNEETEHLYWRVIDKQDGKLLILCDKLIDSFSFNYNPDMTDLDKVTWESCSLLQFLNNEFLDMMFTKEERALVQTTTVENKAANDELLEQWGSWEDCDGIPYSAQTHQVKQDDPDTQDKVFLLSYQEILQYFGEPTETYTGDDYPFTEMQVNPGWKALVTISVDENAIGYFDINTRYGAWMTRTLSTGADTDEMLVTYITSEGQVYNYFTYAPMFIRPAMWISS